MDRKLRDYIFLLGYVAVMYATLPVVPGLSSSMARTLGSNFAMVMNIAVILTVLFAVVIFIRKPRMKSAAVYFMIAAIASIYAFLLFFKIPIVAEKVHLAEYGFLSYLALRVSDHGSKSVPVYARALLIVALVGCGDEFIQKFLPNRVCDIRDVWLNISSGVLALALIWFSKSNDAS